MKFKISRWAMPALVIMALASGAAAGGEEKSKSDASLYTRLGGYDAIVAVTSDLMPRLMADPVLGRFWAHRGADGLAREKQLVVDFIVSRAGGVLHYPGRDLKGSHIGMRITAADWDIFMKHVGATLDKFKLPARERGEVIAFMESTRADILD